MAEPQELRSDNNLFLKHPVLFLSTVATLVCSVAGFWGEYVLLQQFGVNVAVYAELDDFLIAGLRTPSLFGISSIVLMVGGSFIAVSLRRINREAEANRSCKSTLDKECEQIQDSLQRGTVKELSVATQRKSEIEGEMGTLDEEQRELCTREGRTWWSFVIVALLALISLCIRVHSNVLERASEISAGLTPAATVQLRTNERLPHAGDTRKLAFISATERFMFFLLSQDGEPSETIAVPITSIASVHYGNRTVHPRPQGTVTEASFSGLGSTQIVENEDPAVSTGGLPPDMVDGNSTDGGPNTGEPISTAPETGTVQSAAPTNSPRQSQDGE